MSSNNFNEQQAKFIQDRIANVEKYFSELCTGFAAYIRKVARLRDKNDELAQLMLAYSDAETVNKTLSNALANFSTILLSLGDFKDARVQKLDNKVVAELSQYEVICKHAKEEVKQTFISRDKEIGRKKQLDKLRERNPRNRQQIVSISLYTPRTLETVYISLIRYLKLSRISHFCIYRSIQTLFVRQLAH